MKIYLVGREGCEHYVINKIFKNYELALKCYHIIRKELIEEEEECLKREIKEDDISGIRMYKKMIINLKEEDPKKMGNYPHEQPFLDEHELEE